MGEVGVSAEGLVIRSSKSFSNVVVI